MMSSVHPRRAHDWARVYTGAILLMVMVVGAATWALAANAGKVTNGMSSGSVAIGINGAPVDSIASGAAGMLPGDSAQRVVTIDNLGSAAWSTLLMTTYVARGDDSSMLDTDPDLGLQMAVDRCSVPWSANGATYTCPGARTANVAAAGPVVRANVPITASTASEPGSHDYLRIITSLPANAGNEVLGQRTSLTIRFSAVQRTAATL